LLPACRGLLVAISVRLTTADNLEYYIYRYNLYQFRPMKSAEEYKEFADSLRRSKQLDGAIENYLKALELDPSYFNAHANLSLAYADAGNHELAIEHGHEAIRLNPDMAELYSNLGDIFREAGDLDSAEEFLIKAVTLKPGLVHAHFNLGMLYARKDDPENGLNSFYNVIALQPDEATVAKAYTSIGALFSQQGNLQEAIKAKRNAVNANPNDANARSAMLFTLNCDPYISGNELFREHLEWEKHHTPRDASEIINSKVSPEPNGRLKIGYVSADLRYHSVAFFLEPLLRCHDKEKFEIFCYCNNELFDSTTDYLESLSEHWRVISNETDNTVAKLIYDDKINILVDLSGHTAGNRLKVFVRKPAPVQVTWLGYPASTGLHAIDYRLTEEFSDPKGATEKLHSESVVRLPDGFLCYEGNKSEPVAESPPSNKNGFVTFASFNNIHKINPVIVEMWSKILQIVPDSRFLMKTGALTDEKGKAYCLGLFAKHGIAEDRIDWYFRLPKPADHLRLYNQVDISLDTYPYNGTTTTFESLWMGVPVVTLCGDRHISRVGASILKTMKLDKLVAEDADQFVSVATNLAKDKSTLSAYRRDLRKTLQQSPLCDAKGFAAKMEIAYEKIWRDYLKSN